MQLWSQPSGLVLRWSSPRLWAGGLRATAGQGRDSADVRLSPLPPLSPLRRPPCRPAPPSLVAAMGMSASIVLTADDPAGLARLYGALLEVEPQSGLGATHWRVPWPAGGWLEIYAPSRSRPQQQQLERLAPLPCSTPGSAQCWAWAPRCTNRHARNPLAQKPGCWIRRATGCCCWCW